MNNTPSLNNTNWRSASNGFRHFQPAARFWIVTSLLIMAATLMLMPPRPALARVLEGKQPTAKAQRDKVVRKRTVTRKAHAPQAEGVIITAKGAKLKPGYKFIRIDNNTVEVAGNNGRGSKTLRCRCNTGNAAHAATSGSGRTSGGCKMAIFGDLAMCENKGCDGGCRMKIR